MANIARFHDPFAGLTNLHSQLDDIFNAFLSPTATSSSHGMPIMDVYTEDDKQLVADVQVPGFTPDDITVNVDNGILEVKGEKADIKENDTIRKREYMVRESHASFYRSIMLPKQADSDHVTAAFKDGVLKITVPFMELSKPKRITIQSPPKLK